MKVREEEEGQGGRREGEYSKYHTPEEVTKKFRPRSTFHS